MMSKINVTLYMDVYENQNKYFYASSEPTSKSTYNKRYKIIVPIDDPNEPDTEVFISTDNVEEVTP